MILFSSIIEGLPAPALDLASSVLFIWTFCHCMTNQWNVWASMCVFLGKVQRKGEREFALFPFQPSVCVRVSAPPSLFLIPSFSCCQSSLSFYQFVFHLKIIFRCCFSNVNIPFCHHLCLPCFVSIYCNLFWSLFSDLFILFYHHTTFSMFFMVTGKTWKL